jgi:MOSC domain-containing protein YiiM
MPCYKLAIRLEQPDMVKRFLESRRSGFYLAVEREGDLSPGDTVERVGRDERGLRVADVVALYASDSANQALLENASHHPSLPASWREYFRQRLWTPDSD